MRGADVQIGETACCHIRRLCIPRLPSSVPPLLVPLLVIAVAALALTCAAASARARLVVAVSPPPSETAVLAVQRLGLFCADELESVSSTCSANFVRQAGRTRVVRVAVEGFAQGRLGAGAVCGGSLLAAHHAACRRGQRFGPLAAAPGIRSPTKTTHRRGGRENDDCAEAAAARFIRVLAGAQT